MASALNLLQVQNGSKSFGRKTLFQAASAAINEGEHVGVIGPNGAGKTTLFKILVGKEELDSGSVIYSNKLRIGYLEQEAHEPVNKSVEEYLIETSLKPIWELKNIGKGLGLKDEHFQGRFTELSGGYRMRMKLLTLIGREPNLMLLDEPTNYLDLESVLALENFLQGYDGAFLLISHDREFLKRTTDHTLEIEQGEITKFPGNIDDYFEQKAQLRTILEAQASRQDEKRKKVEEFVARFGAKATKAKQAQSRLKALNKMEKIELKDLPIRAKIRIPEPHHTGKETLAIENATLGYGSHTILKSVNLRLERGVHLGVVGYNGAGKSTLLKSLAAKIPLLSGKYQLGYQVELSYFAQHTAEELTPTDTVFDCLTHAAHKDITQQEILNLAGSLLFSGDEIKKSISVLSGGEKSRVALGQILLKRCPLLLLDEPTNHLDFETVEALTEALKNYAGTVVTVSHDRSFIGRVATKILEIRDGHVELYPGNYDDYLWSLERGALKELSQAFAHEDSSAKVSQPGTSQQKLANKKSVNSTLQKDLTRHHQAQAKELQKKITRAEQNLDRLQKELKNLSSNAYQELGKLSQEINNQEEELLTLMQALEEAENYLK